MTNQPRFTYYEDDIGQMLIPLCKDNGKTVARSVYECVDLLNELNNENKRIKQTIQEAYESERTQIGKNVLKQLLEAIQ